MLILKFFSHSDQYNGIYDIDYRLSPIRTNLIPLVECRKKKFIKLKSREICAELTIKFNR